MLRFLDGQQAQLRRLDLARASAVAAGAVPAHVAWPEFFSAPPGDADAVPRADGSVDTSEFRWEEDATADSVTDDLAMLAALGGGPVSVPEELPATVPVMPPDLEWP